MQDRCIGDQLRPRDPSKRRFLGVVAGAYSYAISGTPLKRLDSLLLGKGSETQPDFPVISSDPREEAAVLQNHSDPEKVFTKAQPGSDTLSPGVATTRINPGRSETTLEIALLLDKNVANSLVAVRVVAFSPDDDPIISSSALIKKEPDKSYWPLRNLTGSKENAGGDLAKVEVLVPTPTRAKADLLNNSTLHIFATQKGREKFAEITIAQPEEAAENAPGAK